MTDLVNSTVTIRSPGGASSRLAAVQISQLRY